VVARVRPTYTVNAERTGRWWAITVSELPGVFSQARRLDEVETMARDAIGLYLEAPKDTFDVAVQQVPDTVPGRT
jgi:predicted RNase H-like HicB family nuclease